MTLAVDADAIRDEARPRTRPATRQLRRAIFDDAVEILATEYSRPIRIEEIARRVATSPRQLQRVFDEVGGLGFRAYLRRIRLSHAAELLAETDLTVKQVARRVGYSDVSQFSKAFRRAYGVSPSQAPRLQAARPDRRDPALRRGVERSSKPGSPTQELIKPIGRADIAADSPSPTTRASRSSSVSSQSERFSRSLDAARNRPREADVPPPGEKHK